MSINRFPTISTRRAERSSRNPELPEESLTSDNSDRTEHETVQILPVVRWLCATPHGDGGKMASLVPCVAGKHFFCVDSRNCRSLSRNLIARETLLPREPHTRTSDGILSVPVAHVWWTCTCLSPVFYGIEWLEIASRLFAVTAVFDTSQVTGMAWNEFTARFF